MYLLQTLKEESTFESASSSASGNVPPVEHVSTSFVAPSVEHVSTSPGMPAHTSEGPMSSSSSRPAKRGTAVVEGRTFEVTAKEHLPSGEIRKYVAEMKTPCPMMIVEPALECFRTTCSAADPPGLAVVDTGCQGTMHGTTWRKRFCMALEDFGLTAVCTPVTPMNLNGVGGIAISLEKLTFPVGVFGLDGEITSYEANDEPEPDEPKPKEIPMLMSRGYQASLGCHIHVADRTIDVDAAGVKKQALIENSGGHDAISLTSFSKEGHPGIAELRLNHLSLDADPVGQDSDDIDVAVTFEAFDENIPPPTFFLPAPAEPGKTYDSAEGYEVFLQASGKVCSSTNRKGKKITDMENNLMTEEVEASKVLLGTDSVTTPLQVVVETAFRWSDGLDCVGDALWPLGRPTA